MEASRYTLVDRDISPQHMAVIYECLSISNKFELGELDTGELSHIIVKEGRIPVGYVGDDTFELIDKGKEELKKHHKDLLNLLNIKI